MNYLFLIFLFVFTTESTAAVLDLDKMEQSFILETKRLHIPGYPDAFNPSIVRWENRLLMSFRSRDTITQQATLIGFTWLDEDFNPIGKPQLLDLDWDKVDSYIQDPRLIVVKNKLYMAYSDLLENPEMKAKKRTMCIAEIKHDGARFLATGRDGFHYFQGDKNNKFEKNWVPFDYEGILLLAYTISPHKVFLPVMGEEKCIVFAEISQFNSWNWGLLRGGTTALLINDNHYLAFFHSSTILATVQSKVKSMTHYFMGAYLFESKPPFAIKKISPDPIVSKDFYNGEAYQTWKPLRVIFPCGFVFDQKCIWISYGRQDYEAWIVKMDKSELLKSLIPFDSNF